MRALTPAPAASALRESRQGATKPDRTRQGGAEPRHFATFRDICGHWARCLPVSTVGRGEALGGAASNRRRVSYLLFPGRHLTSTCFQAEYLRRVVRPGDHLVFAITSCNESRSRYNPIPFHVRAIGVDRFAREVCRELGVRCSIFGIPHQKPTPEFVEILVKEIQEQTWGEIDLRPENCRVLCSTPPLIGAYQEFGFEVLPAEAEPDGAGRWVLRHVTPADLVRRVGTLGPAALEDAEVRAGMHPAGLSVLRDFLEVVRTVAELYGEPLLGEEGSLTETRDYDTYVRAMGSAIELKYQDVRPFLLAGRIIDEGCADGALLARIADDFPDSDLIGVDLSAEMLARAAERQRAGDFSGCFVFFRQCNLMKRLPLRSPVDTVLCNSTLHEIWSFGKGAESVREYLALKREQLRRGGRLVIRDVVGPEGRERPVRLWCAATDGELGEAVPLSGSPGELEQALRRQSTAGRFRQLRADFLTPHGCEAAPAPSPRPDGEAWDLSLQAAMEFLLKKDYIDNWQSEMREEFCFWSFSEWRSELEKAGFRLVEGAHAYCNEWRVGHSFQDRVALFDAEGRPLPFPDTNMVLVGERA